MALGWWSTRRMAKGWELRSAAGIAQVSPEADAALVVLADQPFVQAGTIDRLIGVYREQNPQIVIPVYQGFRGNPVLLDRSVFPELLGLAGDIGCRAIFGSHTENIVKAPVDDIGVLLDIDTPGDFEKLQTGLRAGRLGRGAAGIGGSRGAGCRGEPQLVVVGQEAVAKALISLGAADEVHGDGCRSAADPRSGSRRGPDFARSGLFAPGRRRNTW